MTMQHDPVRRRGGPIGAFVAIVVSCGLLIWMMLSHGR